MIKKLPFILPPVFFLLLILGVGYLIWRRPVVDSTPTPTATPENPIPPPTSPVLSSTPTPTEMVTKSSSTSSVTTTIQTSSPTPTPTQTLLTPTNTSTPTLTSIPFTTPSPQITGIVIPDNLNVRWGPGEEYGYVGAVYKNDEVIILGRDPYENWLKVETPNKRSGWVVTRYIKTSVEIENLAILPSPLLPASISTVSSETPRAIDFRRGIDIEGRSIPGKLTPFEEHWYTFQEEDPETVVVFMFKPNVNFYGDHFVGYNLRFFLHDENQIPVWPPGDANSLPNIGAGQKPAKDRDGNLSSGELIWRGGPLVPNVRYYLRFVNTTSETLEYCLMPGDVYEWNCSQN